MAESGQATEGGEETFAASFAQSRLWIADQMDPGQATYNIPMVCRLRGEVKAGDWRAAFAGVMARQESLRTSFAYEGNEVVQRIHPELEVPFRVERLEGGGGAEGREGLDRRIREEAWRPFDLSRAPLWRVVMFEVSATEVVLVMVFHHIIFDGESVPTLFRELEVSLLERAGRSGAASRELPELPIQVVDHAAWQREWMEGGALDQGLTYWREHLKGAPQLLGLPTDFARSAAPASAGGRESLVLEESVAGALERFCGEAGATWFLAVLAAYATVLGRWTGQEVVLVGTPVSLRSRMELEPVIGLFLNTLPIRCDLEAGSTFRELVRRLRGTLMRTLEYRELPFERLVEELAPERRVSEAPVFQAMLNVVPPGPGKGGSWAGCEFETLDLGEVPSKFDLTLYVSVEAPSQDGLGISQAIRLEMVYRRDLFRGERIRECLRQVAQLLGAAAREPDRRLTEFDLTDPTAPGLLPDPRAALDWQWRGTLDAGVWRSVERAPDAVAIEDGWGRWSYAGLARRSERLARALQARGLGRGDWVAIHAVRGGALVCAVLAVMKAGAAWVILDAGHPEAVLVERVRAVRPRGWVAIRAAGPIPKRVRFALSEVRAVRGWELPEGEDSTGWPGEEVDWEGRKVEVTAEDPAYAVFTSGTTGRPKVVVTGHAPGVHFLRWQIATFGLGAGDRVAQLSGLGHDPFLRDVLAPLWAGGTLCIPHPDEVDLGGWLVRMQVSVVHVTPALGRLLMEQAEKASSLRWVFFGGDRLRWEDVQRMRRWAPGVECVNFYGTTETPQAVAWHRVPREEEARAPGGVGCGELVPIGRGIDGVQLWVMSGSGRLAAIGELGEIVVRTRYLSAGYLGEEAGAERYGLNPFGGVAEDRVYRTGDLGRYGPGGEVAFVGRKDAQVKVRGHRVELESVEAALERCEGVKQAAVLWMALEGAEAELVALVVWKADSGEDEGGLREALRQRVMAHEVPTRWLAVDAVRLTRNGKVDRPGMEAEARARWAKGLGTYREENRRPGVAEEPQGDLEQRVATVWREVLGRSDGIGRRTDFFASGGHSLLALKLVGRLNEVFQAGLTLRTLFEARTIAEVAGVLEAGGARGVRSEVTSGEARRVTRTLLGASSGVPFFMIPGFFGLGYLRPSLAHALAAVCPYYDGLRYPGVDDDRVPCDTIEGIASELIGHLAEFGIRAPQPVSLGGFSFGGIVAYEMAVQLVRLGHAVPALVLFDSRLPRSFRVRSNLEVAWELVQRAWRLPRGQRLAYLRSMVTAKWKARGEARRGGGEETSGSPSGVGEDGGGHRLPLPGDVNPVVSRSGLLKETVRLASLKAASRYHPERYGGRVLLFKSMEVPSNEWLRRELDPMNGWGAYVTGGLEVVQVPTDHLGLYTEPLHPLVVERTAAMLRGG